MAFDRYTWNKEWRARNPQKVADNRLRGRYGITMAERDGIYKAQGNRCAGCRKKIDRKVIDHNHKTGKVRGILCHHCNLALGHIRDDANTLRRLACYVENNGVQNFRSATSLSKTMARRKPRKDPRVLAQIPRKGPRASPEAV